MFPNAVAIALAALLLVSPTAAAGQDPPPPPTTTPPPQEPPPPPQPQTLPQLSGSKALNPDISVNGNFVGAIGKNDVAPRSLLDLTEVELAFQAAVDPYARADFFLAASEEGVEIEEGFITFTTLPGNLLLKVGKMRAQFGKANTLHTHSHPAIDRPLILENLLGSDEGLADAGLSLSHIVNNPVLFLELTGEVYRGSSELFQTPEKSRPGYVARARAYKDLSEASNLDLGASFAYGPVDVSEHLSNPIDSLDEDAVLEPVFGNRRLFGIDVTYRYRPLQRTLYRKLNLRTELIWSRQALVEDLRSSAFGMYVLGEYQFARRWFIGGRIDRAERALDSSLDDTAGSVFLTFWPSEFSQIRGQFRRLAYAEGVKANEFLFQFNFSIGAHAAHVF
jgi:hypothetical protein